MYTDRNMELPYCADVHYTTIVLKAFTKYESIKHRRDTIHDKMAHLMEAARSSWSEDSLEEALTDWVYLG